MFSNVFAQKNLWDISDKVEVSNESGQKVKKHLDGLPNNAGLTFAKVNLFKDIRRKDGTIKFSIEKKSEVLSFDVEEFDYKNDADYTLTAKGERGTLTWTCKEGGMGGTLDLVTQVYSIYPTGGNNVAIMKHDMKYQSKEVCGSNDKGDKGKLTTRSNFCGTDCGTATVDVLALLTPAADTWLYNNWGIYGLWWLIVNIHNTNQALANSDIVGKNVRIRTIYFTPDFTLVTPPNANTIGTDRDAMGSSSAIAQLKVQYRADAIVLLTNQGYTSFNPYGSSNTTYGIANTINPNSFQKNCIVEIPFIDDTRFSLAHELAHLMGAWHDDFSLSSAESCAHGQVLNLAGGVTRNTIMTISANNQRIQHFSNPNVNFSGVPTGTTDSRDNASIIRGAFCTVANNMPNPSWSLSTTVQGGGNIKNCCASIYEPQSGLGGLFLTIEGTPPYSYSWSLADNFSGNFYALPETSSCITVQLNSGDIKQLQVVVTSSDGLQLTKTVTLRGGKLFFPFRPTTTKSNNDLVEFYPNPVSKELQIVLPTNTFDPVTDLNLMDQQGKIIKQYKELITDTQIDVSNYPVGLYLVKYNIGDRIITNKIIITK